MAHLLHQVKNPPGILARDGDELVYRYTPHYRHSLGDLAHEGWLVPLPPMGVIAVG